MRYIIIFVMTLFVLMPQYAVANEFGDMFYNKTPVGMADYTAPETETSEIAMDEAAEQVQDIMPAAGEEETAEDTSTEE